MAYFLFPLTKTWGEMAYESKTFSCTIKHEKGFDNPLSIFALKTFLIPLLIMMTSFILVWVKVRKSRMAVLKSLTGRVGLL